MNRSMVSPSSPRLLCQILTSRVQSLESIAQIKPFKTPKTLASLTQKAEVKSCAFFNEESQTKEIAYLVLY